MRTAAPLNMEERCAGLRHLRGMTAMRTLALHGCRRITDQGVRQHLQPLALDHSLGAVSVGPVGATGLTIKVLEILPTCQMMLYGAP